MRLLKNNIHLSGCFVSHVKIHRLFITYIGYFNRSEGGLNL